MVLSFFFLSVLLSPDTPGNDQLTPVRASKNGHAAYASNLPSKVATLSEEPNHSQDEDDDVIPSYQTNWRNFDDNPPSQTDRPCHIVHDDSFHGDVQETPSKAYGKLCINQMLTPKSSKSDARTPTENKVSARGRCSSKKTPVGKLKAGQDINSQFSPGFDALFTSHCNR